MADARAFRVAVAAVLGACGPSIAAEQAGTTSTSAAATSLGDDATTGDRTTSDYGCGFLAGCYADLGSASCDLFAQDQAPPGYANVGACMIAEAP